MVHRIVANDTEPAWEGYLDYGDIPALINDQPNPDLPPLPVDATLTWIQRLEGEPGTVITGTVTVIDPTTRHVRHNFLPSETNVPGQWKFAIQIDYADGRRQTHPDGNYDTLEIVTDLGGPIS